MMNNEIVRTPGLIESRPLFNIRRAILTLFVVSTAGTPSVADVITLPTVPASGSNSIPFGTGSADGRYQQVYSSGSFSGPIRIEALAFEPNGISGPVQYSANVQIRLGTTSAGVNGLSSLLNDNVTNGLTTVFNDSDFLQTLGPGFSLVFDFASNPFLYDPADGNLLLDVLISDKTTNTGTFGFSRVAFNTESSRAFSGGGGSFAGIGALSTRITFSDSQVVPESEAILVWLVVGSIVVLWYRRRGNVAIT